ncbi:FG-GAP repeat domain-containing protein [Paludisphaera borealis]|uniref:FG-GAP repeat domain-containing protein n=1 Tax=Paludisphaera borealis TaxID=1387353 RepID=UPI0009F8633E|nr:VCBS repeat-containing protein [Paludisphaera borealis]
MTRRLFILTGWFALATTIAVAAVWATSLYMIRGSLDRADREMEASDYTAAAARLRAIRRWQPSDPEIAFRLGVCEEHLDRPDAAIAAWASVATESPYWGPAAHGRARLAIKHLGAFRDAETLLTALRDRKDPASARSDWMLAELWIWQGRMGEVRRVFEGLFGKVRSDDRRTALREHWRLDAMLEGREDADQPLQAATERSPDDDRAWLARANIALRSGKLDEAGDWLRRCEAQGKGDAAVNRLRVQWAMSADRPDEVRRGLLDLSADRLEPVDALAIRAWTAGRAHDNRAEADALEGRLAIEPDSVSALDRLAVLAAERGDRERAVEIRRNRAKIEEDRQAYRRLMIGDLQVLTPARLEDCARLAEALGRTFEARGWWTLVLERASNSKVARERLEALAAQPPRPTRVSTAEFQSLLASLVSSSLAKETEGVATKTRGLAFVDRAKDAGLAFVYENGETEIHQIPETIGGGVGLLDYDGDGRLDVYFTQGGAIPPTSPQTSRDRLFRNKGDGAFEDVTARSGLATTTGGYGFGVSVGDYDGDGRPDLFVTRWRSHALYRNKGDGTFEDVTEAMGLGGDRDWPTSSAFADLDGDGDLDLYVCHYLAWDAQHPTLCPNSRGTNRYVSCYPPSFPALRDRLFRNDGGRFVDVTVTAGIDDPDGRGLGVVAADLDDDGLIDLVVANDMSANLFYRNKGGMRFEEFAHEAGLAGNAEGATRRAWAWPAAT